MANESQSGGDQAYENILEKAHEDAIKLRDKTREEAVKLFESHPDFARVQVRMREGMKKAARKCSGDARVFGTRARLQYVLDRFDIRARAFWKLVSDIQTQNAFIVTLDYLNSLAWKEFSGGPIEIIRPASDQADADLQTIHARVQNWTKKGYSRVALSSNRPIRTHTDGRPTGSETSGKRVASVPEFPTRASWLKERLQERSWNKHDLQRQGGPYHKTVQKILDGVAVREDVIQKVADGLSKHKVGIVKLLDIPPN